MSTTVIARRPERSGYRFTDVARMEGIKLRTLRSTGWITLILAAGMLGLAVVVMSHTNFAKLSPADRASFDPTELGFVGLALSQLLMAVLGVLTITSEFSSGMIRATLAAAPQRPMLLAAKAAVLGVAGLAVGEVLAFAAFLAGQAVLATPAPHATLAQPGVLRAILMAGALAALLAQDPANRWCVTLTGPAGHPVAHACAPRGPGAPPGPAVPPGPAAPPGPGTRAGPGDGSPGRGPARGQPPAARPSGAGPPGWLRTLTFTTLQTHDCTHPRESPGYQPSRALRHLIEIRNPTCTAPGCRRAADRCDLDYVTPYDHGGKTCECNLGPASKS